MSAVSLRTRFVFFVFILLLAGGGVGSKALLGQTSPDPGYEDPVPEEPDPSLLPAVDLTLEAPPVIDELTIDPTLPVWGDALDSTGTAVDPCPACQPGITQANVPRFECSGYSQAVSPLKRCSSTSKFLCAGGTSTPIPLVGVSDDASCHLFYTSSDHVRDLCNQTNWKQVIDNMACYKLNKMRLWVSLNGNPEPGSDPTTSFPFLYNTAGGHWRLDQKNTAYFDRLVDVISRAKARGIFVEVTFFAPWEGDWSNGQTGPFAGSKGKWCLDSTPHSPGDFTCTNTNLVTAGFDTTTAQDFTVMSEGRGATGLDTQIKRAREAQRNVIRWTVERLWCFDNVYFEIANEPEASKVASVTPLQVAIWEAEMIKTLLAAETPRVTPSGFLQSNHLISVQPFTTDGVNYVSGSPPAGAQELSNVGLINGHYTTVKATGPTLNVGAIKLGRDFSRTKPLGFNETKISGIPATANITVKGGTDPLGGAASARSEGWEFLVSLGAVYDHWGYYYGSANGQEVRREMCYLKSFVSQLPLAQLSPQLSTISSGIPVGTPPNWVNVPVYPAPPESLAAGTTYTYWAASAPTSQTMASPQYVLYLHRDQRSCLAAGSNCETHAITAFRGYHPSSSSQSPLTLKNLIPGFYNLSWIKPDRASAISGVTLTFNANQSCSLNGGAAINPCTVSVPSFSYDITLWLKRPPAGSSDPNM